MMRRAFLFIALAIALPAAAQESYTIRGQTPKGVLRVRPLTGA
jgi:hypothetical protein